MTLDPQTISAIGTVIVSLAGLVTAIHAHGKSTQATTDANTSAARASALERVLLEAVPQLVTAFGVRLPSSSPVATTAPQPALTPLAPVVGRIGYTGNPMLGELSNWLAEQHKAETGTYPHEGGPITDFSKVLAHIAMLELKQGPQ